ncbi:MAG TPA: hypothetical protein PL009_00495 [Flavipsychrobacter sp.]|nr:hypothetical protein [Flavipsychrobacter sp.]
MKYIIAVLTCAGLIVMWGYNLLPAIAIALWVFTAYELFVNANKRLAFREFMLTLYGMNFLLSPAMTYHTPDLANGYPMKIPEEQYFEIAIPAMLCLRAGLYWIKTEIFSFNFNLAKLQAIANQEVLRFWLIAGVLLKLVYPFVPGDIGFVIYLLATVRFIAAFSLYAVDARKYRWWLVLILFFEVSSSVASGMFHDTVMWLIFFGIYWCFLRKPSVAKKIAIGIAAIACFIVLQVSKSTYRQQAGEGGDFGIFVEILSDNASKGVFAEENVNSSVNRVNQAWIFASTIQNMDRRGDFQGLRLVGLYAEAALLPRALAPNKLSSGNKEIFRRYSGHYLRDGTSMGLGILGDGYVAFGYFGTLIFCLILGLLFGVVFKIVEGWARISPYFILFIFPVLNYAVRPDCETQTIITHLVKATVLFGLMMLYYRRYFRKRIYFLQKKEDDQAEKVFKPYPA